MRKSLIIFILFSFIFFTIFLTLGMTKLASAQEVFYADIDIYVSNDGIVTFEGTTNHPLLSGESDELTSKKGKFWVINISTSESFSDFIYRLHLPKGADMNYLKTPGLSRIVQDDDGFVIIGAGSNSRLVIVSQYSFKKTFSNNHVVKIVILSVVMLVFLCLVVWFIVINKRKSLKPSPLGLSDRQKSILMIVSRNKQIKQAKLEKLTGFPKSSLSRNVDSLVRKGYIEKEVSGMSNILRLKEAKSDK